MTVTCPHGNPVRAGEPFTLDQCRICWLRAGGVPSAPVRPAKVTLACVYLGTEEYAKGVRLCNHPDEPLGMWVCTCRGCGPRCPGYQSADAR